MVLAIKLRDNIFVPQSVIESGKYLLGLNYALAQNKIKALFGINDELLFEGFLTQISTQFKTDVLFNLYHLVDSLSISELLLANDLSNKNLIATSPSPPPPESFLPIENYLNYLGFEIKKRPNKRQLNLLINLKSQNIISEFWLEGETRQIKGSQDFDVRDVFGDSTGIGFPNFAQNEFDSSEQLLPAGIDIDKNNFLKNLDYQIHENRGVGATIIIIEADATNKLDKIGNKVNINNFLNQSASIDSFGDMADGSVHQLQTLITLYGDNNGQITGLVPKANLVICSLRDIRGFNPEDFLNRKNDILSLLRKNLFITLKQRRKNTILLLEFETLIPVGPTSTLDNEYYPSYIIYDIKKRFDEITIQHNTIVVGGVGNTEKDFNDLNPIPWKLRGYSYINLTKKDLPFIMVAAVEKVANNTDFTIEKESNFGKEMDIYMYTNFNIGEIGRFPGTSGASAATAGIIAFLQGRAFSGIVGNGDMPSPNMPIRRKLSIQNVKNIFERTFMSTFPRDPQTKLTHETTGLIHKTTFAELWIQCEIELNRQASQRQ